MRRLTAYLRTLRQYAATPKGWHDMLDDLRAVGIFLVLTALVFMILCIVR
ncbi:MAG: hypothetical protein ACFNQB_03590 [Selenomonas noxia]|nr:hypothetical protein [Selenomonas noxia]